MNVLGLISSLTDPSSRARILQYRDYLKELDININPRYFFPQSYADPAPWAYTLNKITKINPWRFLWIQKSISRIPLLFQQYNYDIIWQNRLVLPHQTFYERKFVKPIVFDYDDAIWLHDGEQKVAEAISRSAMVFAGNEYLAEFARPHNKNIQIVPSTIDTTRLYPLPTKTSSFTIGWMGSVSNLRFLEMIREPVNEFLARYHDARFMVVSSEKPVGFTFDDKRILFRRWDADQEHEHINEFSIGIMPLTDDAFTRGKCSYKMLQYMACGKPVVVSPVGMNNKILVEDEPGMAAQTHADWLKAFIMLKNDIAYYQACSARARKAVVDKYDCAFWATHIAGLFKKQLAAG
jgi:glycosyltransferase involved in cell wall biosynthesis